MKLAVSKIKRNPKNPRVIKDSKFEQLKESIRSFPEMLTLLPLVVDEKNVCLSGNMRLKALQELGIPEVEIIRAKDLTEEKKREFMLKANAHAGEWDRELLLKDWDMDLAKGWGLEFSFDDNTKVSFTAKNKDKGTTLKVMCKTPDQAAQLATELIGRGLDVEIK